MNAPPERWLPACVWAFYKRKKTKKGRVGKNRELYKNWCASLMSEPVYDRVFICVTYSAIQNEATEKEDVLVCVFRQAEREILLSGEYKTTRQAIKRVLILNQARHQLFKKFVCQSLTLLVCVAIFFNNTQHKPMWRFISVMWRRREKEGEEWKRRDRDRLTALKCMCLRKQAKQWLQRCSHFRKITVNNVNYNLRIRFNRIFTRKVVCWKRLCSQLISF